MKAGGGFGEVGKAMRIHLATWPPEKQVEQTLVQASAQRMQPSMKLRILLSYHYYKDTDLDALFAKYFTPPYPDVFADSGGFSAMTQGVTIDINAYAAWVKRYKHLFAVYANLDVIGNPDATWRNQQTLEDAGLAPLPVFHTGTDFKWLEHYIERYPYMALGGMVPYMKFPKKIMPWLIQCFRLAEGETVFHGFGATAWKVVSALPWYSVDSSSWGQGFRFGQVPLFDTKAGRFRDCALGDVEGCRALALLFGELGFDWRDFADRSRNDRAKICAVSALSYMKAERHLRRRHGEIVIPHREGAGEVLRLHLADANPQRYGDTVTGIRQVQADTSNGVNYGDADKGIKLHLADARGPNGGDLAAADAGLRLHLAEHSMDRGGVGDTSRAMEILNESNRNR